MDGGASSPARCRVSNLRFEPSAVSPSAKPENPLGFQPSCHPYQFLLKSFRFPGAKTARKRFLLWKMGFSAAKIAPHPPYTPPGTIGSSRGLRPSRALREVFDNPNSGKPTLSRTLRGFSDGLRALPLWESPAAPRRRILRLCKFSSISSAGVDNSCVTCYNI